jgi:hypothetical protein
MHDDETAELAINQRADPESTVGVLCTHVQPYFFRQIKKIETPVVEPDPSTNSLYESFGPRHFAQASKGRGAAGVPGGVLVSPA